MALGRAIARGLNRRRQYGDTSDLYLGKTYNVIKFCIPCQNTKKDHSNCINGEFKPFQIKKQVKIEDTWVILLVGLAATAFGIFNYDDLFRMIFGLVVGLLLLYSFIDSFFHGTRVTEDGFHIRGMMMKSSGKWIDEPLFFVIGRKLMIIEKTSMKKTFLTEGSFLNPKVISSSHGPNEGKLADFYNADYQPPPKYEILFIYRLWEQAMNRSRVYRVYNASKRKDKIDEVQIVDEPQSL